jgi:hypothetical protein
VVNLKPSEIADDKPVSEHVIFQALQGITDKPNWVALHSLKQNVVKQGVEAETDFVVFIPGKGIVLIEAKGATSATAVGTQWTMEGVPPKAKNKNPFEQIDNAKRNVRGQLTKLGYQVDDIPMARLVWFTKISPFQVDSSRGMAFSHWELAYQEDLARPAKALEKVLNEEIQSKQGNPTVNYKPKTLTEGLSAEIANSLIGRLAANSTPENLAIERRMLVRKATDEQLLLLSLVENNNHVYFEGEAGSGKTELLVRSAVDMARDRKVLYTCYNVMLAEQIQKDIGAHTNIDVLDLNQVLLRIAGKKANPKNAGTDWYERELPELALDAVLKRGPSLPRYEAICFDEFQDIASRPLAFDAITSLLKKDHRPAKVMMAGDDEQQIMSSGTPVPSFASAKKAFPNLVHISLKTNCRQAPGLSKAIHKLLGWSQNHLSHRLPGTSDWGLEVIATTPEKQAKDLYKVLVRLQKTIAPENIRVLSPFGEKNSVLAKLFKDSDTHSSELRSLKKLLKHESTEGKIRWRSIPKYKGLESDVVVITDVSQSTKDWLAANQKFLANQLYVGMTRAKFQVVLLVSDGLYSATNKSDGTPLD